MTSVFKIVEETRSGAFTSWVTENGKILQTSVHYDSGLKARYTIDFCVDIDPSVWVDSCSSIADLYWLVEEDLSDVPLYKFEIEEVDYPYDFSEKAPTRSMIGDSEVVTPKELLARMGKFAVSAV